MDKHPRDALKITKSVKTSPLTLKVGTFKSSVSIK